jgi:hypothetical protein
MIKVIELLSDSDSENGEDDGVVEVTQPVPRMKQFSICVPGKPQSMPAWIGKVNTASVLRRSSGYSHRVLHQTTELILCFQQQI